MAFGGHGQAVLAAVDGTFDDASWDLRRDLVLSPREDQYTLAMTVCKRH